MRAPRIEESQQQKQTVLLQDALLWSKLLRQAELELATFAFQAAMLRLTPAALFDGP